MANWTKKWENYVFFPKKIWKYISRYALTIVFEDEILIY